MGKPMTAAQLRKALDTLGLSQLSAAKFFGVNPRTMRAYVLGEYTVPDLMAQFARGMVERGISPESVKYPSEKEIKSEIDNAVHRFVLARLDGAAG